MIGADITVIKRIASLRRIGAIRFAYAAYTIAVGLLFFLTTTAMAQQAPPGQPQPAPAPAPAVLNPTAPAAQPPAPSPAPARDNLNIPSVITVELRSPPSSALGVSGWSAIIVALLTAGASIAVAVLTAKKNKDLQTDLQNKRLQQEALLADLNRGHETSTEQGRLAQARAELSQRTDASALEVEQAAWKIVHEQQVEEAKLIHMYFDKLISSNLREQELAFFAISAFVDASVIESLASAGERLIPLSQVVPHLAFEERRIRSGAGAGILREA